MPTHAHLVSLRYDNQVRSWRDELDLLSIGVARWCIDLIASESPLRSPSLEPTRGPGTAMTDDGSVELTTVEAAAFARPDPLLEVARSYLDAIATGNLPAAVREAKRIWANVPARCLEDRCRKCEGPISKNPRRGECSRCVKAEQRSKERTA